MLSTKEGAEDGGVGLDRGVGAMTSWMDPVGDCGQPIRELPRADGLVMRVGHVEKHSTRFVLVNCSDQMHVVKPMGIIVLVDEDGRLLSIAAHKMSKVGRARLSPGESVTVTIMVNTTRCDTFNEEEGPIPPGTYHAVAVLDEVDEVSNVEIPLEPPWITLHDEPPGFTLTD